jgi:hypothetical protein
MQEIRGHTFDDAIETRNFVSQIDQFFQEVVFGFIFNDLDAAARARANYLTALGLVAYTEFMGGLVLGSLGKGVSSRKRFYAFWDRMGDEYRALRLSPAVK